MQKVERTGDKVDRTGNIVAGSVDFAAGSFGLDKVWTFVENLLRHSTLHQCIAFHSYSL